MLKKVVLYSKVDGEFIIMDAQFKEFGRTENLMDVFNTDKRFIEVFAYNCSIDEHDEDGEVIGVHGLTIYTPNLEVVEDVAHYIAYNEIEKYAEDPSKFFIWSIIEDDFVGECKQSEQKDEMLGWITDFIGEEEYALVYPTNGKRS